MKTHSYILSSLIAITMLSCQDGGKENDLKDTPDGGAQQVDPPVQNSGIETERDRALEAVQQDTTNKEVHVGKDAEAENPKQKKDTTK